MTRDPELERLSKLINELMAFDIPSISAVKALYAQCGKIIADLDFEVARIAREWTAEIFATPAPAPESEAPGE